MNLEKTIKEAVEEAINDSTIQSEIAEHVATIIQELPVEEVIEKESLEDWARDNGWSKGEEWRKNNYRVIQSL